MSEQKTDYCTSCGRSWSFLDGTEKLRARVADQANELFTAQDVITRLSARVAELEAEKGDKTFLARAIARAEKAEAFVAELEVAARDFEECLSLDCDGPERDRLLAVLAKGRAV